MNPTLHLFSFMLIDIEVWKQSPGLNNLIGIWSSFRSGLVYQPHGS